MLCDFPKTVPVSYWEKIQTYSIIHQKRGAGKEEEEERKKEEKVDYLFCATTSLSIWDSKIRNVHREHDFTKEAGHQTGCMAWRRSEITILGDSRWHNK